MEDFETPHATEVLVYDKARFLEGQSPALLFMPSKPVMIKLMRACVEVQTPKDLWFNK